ncbi:hypothetical protein ABW20_dc0109028 [Dactylellina cionopaga]|nr:hypothetical protein ABW20_dc0109028 [Dactylellina cionopaga]
MQPSSELLRHLLSRGASVHIRNRENHTPLYVAADAGYPENVKLLREAGAHLHPDEVELAEMLKKKASRSSTSSMSNSPVGGSSANATLTVPEEKRPTAHAAAAAAAAATADHASAAGAGSKSASLGNGLGNGLENEAADCWTLAGV